MSQLPSRDFHAKIIDRGRGPELAGTRITVYQIVEYRRYGYTTPEIAAMLDISEDDVQILMNYIRDHAQEIEPEYERILSTSAS
jgi:uncharacterized protein (DUF433 family)